MYNQVGSKMETALIGLEYTCQGKTATGAVFESVNKNLDFYRVGLSDTEVVINELSDFLKKDIDSCVLVMFDEGSQVECKYVIVYKSQIIKNSISIYYDDMYWNAIQTAIGFYKDDLETMLYLAIADTEYNMELEL